MIDRSEGERLANVLKRFEHAVTTVLIVMMAIVVVLSVAELGWVIVKDVISPPVLFLDIDELLDLFGLFLLVLIGVELLETIKAYVSEGVIRVEVVILVAMLAIGRKIITLDLKKVPSVSLLGIAAIIAALAIAYYVFKRAHDTGAAARKSEDT